MLNNSQTTKVRNYLYLENAGFFISDDNGQNWVHKSNVVSNEYRDEGTVKYSNDTIFIAIKNRGVYYAKERKVYETGSAIYEFEKLNTFTSAEQIEHKYFPIDGKSIVYVFGKNPVIMIINFILRHLELQEITHPFQQLYLISEV